MVDIYKDILGKGGRKLVCGRERRNITPIAGIEPRSLKFQVNAPIISAPRLADVIILSTFACSLSLREVSVAFYTNKVFAAFQF